MKWCLSLGEPVPVLRRMSDRPKIGEVLSGNFPTKVMQPSKKCSDVRTLVIYHQMFLPQKQNRTAVEKSDLKHSKNLFG